MKRLSVSFVLILFIVLSACTREKSEAFNPRILGKWMLDRNVEEEYHPINTLTYSDEYIGKAGDSVVFLAPRSLTPMKGISMKMITGLLTTAQSGSNTRPIRSGN